MREKQHREYTEEYIIPVMPAECVDWECFLLARHKHEDNKVAMQWKHLAAEGLHRGHIYRHLNTFRRVEKPE